MPTTIDSAGITFNDATSFTSAVLAANSVGATQITNGSVTAAKLGTTEQKQICKAWVNFNGNIIQLNSTAVNGESITVNSGSNTGTWVTPSSWLTSYVGTIFYINSIAGVSGANLGGVNVATSGIQIISVSGTSATIRLLAGTAISSQTITGTGSASTGYVYSTSGIRSSYNVSSVTKNGTGDYTVNFTTAMADANYSVNATGSIASTNATSGFIASISDTITPRTIFLFRIITANSSFVTTECAQVSVSVFGN
jgi:hypothetical protein